MQTDAHPSFDRNLERLREALTPVVRPVFGPPHVYSACIPSFQSNPEAERPPAAHDVLRLYAHVPFCNYSCSFCFYAKRVGTGRPQMERYVDAMLRELEWVQPGTPLSQLFVGGGTPTSLPPEVLDRLLEGIFSRVEQVAGKVHTVETSPESISDEHLDVLRSRGIGRLSMGIQSLDDAVLAGVQRRHGRDESEKACTRILEAGFILNVDLIYGLPGQTEESFRRDMEAVAQFGVHAVTLYDLRTNVRTPVLRTLAQQERLDLQRLLHWRAVVKEAAESQGFTQTRWHTFKKLDSVAATHEREDTFTPDASGYQFGIGASARSHLGYTIFRNHSTMERYVDRIENGLSPVEETIALGDKARRTMFISRTLGDGKPLDPAVWKEAFGDSLESFHGDNLNSLIDAGLVLKRDGRYELTATGALIHDLVTLTFYAAEDRRWLVAQTEEAGAKYPGAGAQVAP